jgi:adenosylmethionine-8-amino-7-oxononanoate aminotransferase
LGITSATEDIYEAFLSNDLQKTFFHGHSFTANPIACSAALASLDLFENEDCWENIHRICQKNIEFQKRLSENKAIKEIRVKGTILALEINTQKETSYLNELRNFIGPYFLKKGILVRPLGNIIYLVPPYCISDADMDYICQVIESCLNELKEYEYR